MKSPFTIKPRVIAHLGEDLIKNESIALLELVKNSYDANATECFVNFTFDDQNRLSRLSIKDNGDGMTIDTIQNVWLVIGTDNKKQILENGKPVGRVPLGEKGIGRLGVHKLGNRITIYTKVQGQKEVRVYIDWELLNTSRQVDDFVIDIDELQESSFFPGDNHGTIIIIDSLKSEWDKRMLRNVHRDLTSLSSPFSQRNDSFVVSINSNNNTFDGLPNIQEILNVGMYSAHCTIENNQITSFQYEFRPWNSLTRIQGRTVSSIDAEESMLIKKVEEVGPSGRMSTRTVPLDLSPFKIGKIEMDVVIFERDLSVFSYVNTEKRSLNEYLRENGGIRVYRDGVRVYNYGEKDNDWLGLDTRRVARSGGAVGNRMVIGSVSLDRTKSVDLKEKTNREGFIEDEAYYAFVDAVKYAFDRIISHRNMDRYNLLAIYKPTSHASEPVIGELTEVMDLIDSAVKDEQEKQTIKNYLVRIETQYRDVRDTLIKSANAGLNLGIAIHEMEKNIASLKKFASNGDVDKIKDLAEHLEKIVAGYSVFLTNSERKQHDVSQIVKIVIENNSFRFSDHRIRVFSNYMSFHGKAMLSKAESIASLTNLIDNAIYWVSRCRTDDRMIYIYITDELKGYTTIAVCDNGPGFKLSPQQAIQPFVTDKPLNTGMGLGLHITNEVMNAMKGKLLIMDPHDLQLPEKIKDYSDNPTVVALSFPQE